MGCSSGIPQLSQTHRFSGLPFYGQSFLRFPQGTSDVVPISRTCLLGHQKIHTLTAVAFIAEHRTKAVDDQVVLAILICMMNGNWLIGLIGAMYESSSASTWRFCERA
ncbi:unnamed protein product [Prunus armeniaca]